MNKQLNMHTHTIHYIMCAYFSTFFSLSLFQRIKKEEEIFRWVNRSVSVHVHIESWKKREKNEIRCLKRYVLNVGHVPFVSLYKLPRENKMRISIIYVVYTSAHAHAHVAKTSRVSPVICPVTGVYVCVRIGERWFWWALLNKYYISLFNDVVRWSTTQQ